MTSRVAAALALAILTGALLSTTNVSATVDPVRIFVTVADNKSKPMAGLTAADFRVLVDDVPMEIISVAPAKEPVSAIILTDRLGVESAYSPFDLARALRNFVKTLNSVAPGSQYALTTFDGPVVRVAPFGLPPSEFDKIIGRLATVAKDSAIRDAILDVCAMARKTPTSRRAIFTVFGGYRPDMSTARVELVGQALEVCDASWWVIEARTTGENSFGNNDRELVVDRGTALSGGTREIVASAIGVDAMSKRMAELIGGQYALTYAATGNTRRDSVRKVMVARKDVKVFAPAWIR